MERADLCVSGLDPIMYEELFSVRECFSTNPAVIPIPTTTSVAPAPMSRPLPAAKPAPSTAAAASEVVLPPSERIQNQSSAQSQPEPTHAPSSPASHASSTHPSYASPSAAASSSAAQSQNGRTASALGAAGGSKGTWEDEKSGWLTKQGGRLKTWKKRWCVLKTCGTDGVLSYSEKDKDKMTEKGEIKLGGCGIRPLPNVKEYAFEIYPTVAGQAMGGNHDSYILSASTFTEMEEWISEIKRVIAILTAPAPQVKSTAAPSNVRKKPKGPTLCSYFMFHAHPIIEDTGHWARRNADEYHALLLARFNQENQPGSEKHQEVVVSWLNESRDDILSIVRSKPIESFCAYLLMSLMCSFKKMEEDDWWADMGPVELPPDAKGSASYPTHERVLGDAGPKLSHATMTRPKKSGSAARSPLGSGSNQPKPE